MSHGELEPPPKLYIGQVSTSRARPNLDVLRSCAVLFVVHSHLVPGFGIPDGAAYHWQGLGILGVVLFFVHTCLVLMFSLRRQLERPGRYRLSAIFFTRRAFRIYPLSMVTVGLSFALAAIGWAPVAPFSGGALLANAALVQNLTGTPSVPASLWSLPFEIQMYLVLPSLFLLVQSDLRRGRWLILGLWIVSSAANLGLKSAHIDYQLFKYLPCFLPGVLAYTLGGQKPTLTPWILLAFLGFLAVLFPLLVKAGLPETLLSWPVCLALGALLPLVREVTSPLAQRVVHLIAKYSYGIYLTHGWAIWLAAEKMIGQPLALQFAAFFTSTALLAWASYTLIEEPGIELGNWVAGRIGAG